MFRNSSPSPLPLPPAQNQFSDKRFLYQQTPSVEEVLLTRRIRSSTAIPTLRKPKSHTPKSRLVNSLSDSLLNEIQPLKKLKSPPAKAKYPKQKLPTSPVINDFLLKIPDTQSSESGFEQSQDFPAVIQKSGHFSSTFSTNERIDMLAEQCKLLFERVDHIQRSYSSQLLTNTHPNATQPHQTHGPILQDDSQSELPRWLLSASVSSPEPNMSGNFWERSLRSRSELKTSQSLISPHRVTFQNTTASLPLIHSSSALASNTNPQNDDTMRERLRDVQREARSLHASLMSISQTLTQLDDKMTGEITQEQFQAAATMIGKVIRGFIARKRYSRFREAIQAWRRDLTQKSQLLCAIDSYLAHRRVVKDRLSVLATTRRMRILDRHVRAWRLFTVASLPERKEKFNKATELMHINVNRHLKRIVWKWSELSHGPHSRKKLIFKAVKRREEVYQRLLAAEKEKSLKGTKVSGPLLIDESMIRREIQRANVAHMQKRLSHSRLVTFFQAWTNVVLDPWREKLKKSLCHYNNRILTRIWTTWSKYLELNAQDRIGSSIAVDKWKHKKENAWKRQRCINKIQYRSEIRRMRSHFSAWKKIAHRRSVAHTFYRYHATRNIALVFGLWAAEAKRTHKIRQLAISEWREYSIFMRKTPFRAWYIYSTQRRMRRTAQNAVLNAFHRRKKSQILVDHFKRWKHQSIYGKVEGMRTRMELVKALDDQKAACHALEETVTRYRKLLSESESTLEKQEKRILDASAALQSKEDELRRKEFALHNAEQEIVRLQAVLDSIALVHPKSVAHMYNLEHEKQYSDRGLPPLARLAKESIIQSSETNKTECESPEERAKPLVAIEQPSIQDIEMLERCKLVLQKVHIRAAIETRNEFVEELQRLYGLLEYMATGETNPLLDPPKPQIADNALETEGKEITELHRPLLDKKITWHEFVQNIALRMPSRKEPTQRLQDQITRYQKEASERRYRSSVGINVYRMEEDGDEVKEIASTWSLENK